MRLQPPKQDEHAMVDTELRLALMMRLRQPVLAEATPCMHCCDTIDHKRPSEADHALHCPTGDRAVRRRNAVARTVADIVKVAPEAAVALEPVTTRVRAGADAPRPDTVWHTPGRPRRWGDFQATSPLTRKALRKNTAAQVDGFAAQIATVAKRRRWEPAPATPLVLETLGRASADLVALIRQAGALTRDTANHWQTLQVQLQRYNA